MELGLQFCGFEDGKVLEEFKLSNIGLEDLYDLNKWNKFEQNNPDAFIGMYTFWCQKI